MVDEDNYRFSTRISDIHKIKKSKLKIKNRRLVETAIDEAYADIEKYEKIIEYHYYKNRLLQVDYELNKLFSEKDMIKSHLEELEYELEGDSDKVNEIKNPELREAINIVQNAIFNKRGLYISDRVSNEKIVDNFVKDHQEFINATFNAPYIPKLSDEERKEYLSKYIDFEKLRK